MGDLTAFEKILFERRRFLMSAELEELRNRALGMPQFARVLNGGELPFGLQTNDGAADLVRQANLYVTDAAWGVSALILKGLLPPVKTQFTESVGQKMRKPHPEWKAFLQKIPKADQAIMQGPIDRLS